MIGDSGKGVLDPEVLRPWLAAVGLYIAAYEILTDAIVERPRSFFAEGITASGVEVGDEYKKEVGSLNASPVYASLAWLQRQGAVSGQDIVDFERIKACRNRLAHELAKLLESEGRPSDFYDCFGYLLLLLKKIEVWWIVEVEIPTSPDFEGKEINVEEVVPGTVILVKMLQDVGLGGPVESRAYLNALTTLQQGKGGS